MICIIDYEAGNLRSVKRALDFLGVESVVSNSAEVIKQSDKLIFPGVGAAGEAMRILKKLQLDKAIKEAIKDKKKMLGICVGTQIILQSSAENDTETLGLIKGKCEKFELPPEFPIPHMGWNQVNYQQEHPIFKGIPSGTNFYFVHSYYPQLEDEKLIIATSEYGGKIFTTTLCQDNLVATQFHPEKSGKYGLKLLQNFIDWKEKC